MVRTPTGLRSLAIMLWVSTLTWLVGCHAGHPSAGAIRWTEPTGGKQRLYKHILLVDSAPRQHPSRLGATDTTGRYLFGQTERELVVANATNTPQTHR